MYQLQLKEALKFKFQGDNMNNEEFPNSAPSSNNNNTLEIRVTRLEVKVDHIQTDVSDIKIKLERMEEKFDDKFAKMEEKFDGKFAKIDDKFAKIDDKFDKLYYLLFSTLAAVIIGILVQIGTHFV